MNKKVYVTILSLLIIMNVSLGCSNEICSNILVTSIDSPDNKYVAYIFKRDCGSTTKVSFQLSILKKGQELSNSKGNIYISYGEFNVEWNSTNELLVESVYDDSEVFKQKSRYKGIEITYD